MDRLGSSYTLIRFDKALDVGPLLDAAVSAKVPLAVLDVEPEAAAFPFPEKMLIVRPDTHIAWRGLAAPKDPIQLVNRLRGAAELGVRLCRVSPEDRPPT